MITRYASFVAFNKVYSTDVNKRVHYVRVGQFKTAPRHTRDDCKLGGWGAMLSMLSCVCDNYQQAINTRYAPRFLLQPTVQSVCGHTGSQCFDEGNRCNWTGPGLNGTWVGTRVSNTPGVLTSLPIMCCVGHYMLLYLPICKGKCKDNVDLYSNWS